MALFRFHRGDLASSLATTIIVKNKKELEEKILEWESEMPSTDEKKEIKISNYIFDTRIGWHTQVVEILFYKNKDDEVHRSSCVVGFLSEPF